MSVLIVESPGKIKKISSFLGPNYIVKASVGHIRDLKDDELSIDVDNDFTPTYVICKGKHNVVADLKTVIQGRQVFIATDADREGEGIAYHLVETLKLEDCKRITFTEITHQAITRAIANPRMLDINLVNAQVARRLADRLVGYLLTPIVRRATGRVQSVAVRLLVDKEKEVEAATRNKSIVVSADFFGTTFHPPEKYSTLLGAQLLLQIVQLDRVFKVVKCNSETRLVHPPAPFITSTLQQDAAKVLKLPVATTMKIAQTLYEKGHITYMRTDCPVLSNEAQQSIIAHVRNTYGPQYVQSRVFSAKAKNAQEAHEAIRPTHFEKSSLEDVTQQENALYELIWKRTVASQMAPAKYADNHVTVSNSMFITFEGTLVNLVFEGFRVLYDAKDNMIPIPSIDSDAEWTTMTAVEHYNDPPGRYDEPSLVKTMERLGIGRPSTYATIISKIQEHGYVTIKDVPGDKMDIETLTLKNKPKAAITHANKSQTIGKESKRMVPTEVAKQVTAFLMEKFPSIVNTDFTNKLEEQLDDVAAGKMNWINVLKGLYGIIHVSSNIEKMPIRHNATYPVLGKHPSLDVDLYYVTNKFGNAIRFYSKQYGKDIYVNVNNLKKKLTMEVAVEMCNKRLEGLAATEAR